MGFVSLAAIGRVLFAFTFLFCANQEVREFGSDGGPAAKYLEPKFNLFVKQVFTYTGLALPHVQIKTVIIAGVYFRAVGAPIFIMYHTFGAFLLLFYLAFITPVVYDFYNYEMGSPQFIQLFTQFSQNLALFGALLFFLEMKNSIPRRQNSIPRRRSKTGTTKVKKT